MHCGTEIRPRDNVPVLSYVFLRGRCRACAEPIGWRYPAVEIATAVLIAACVLDFGVTVRALAACVFCIALVAVSATDLERRIVPNRVVLPASAAVLVLNLIWHPTAVWPIAGLGAALFFFLAALAYPRGMGMGDVKLALLVGVAVGKPTPIAIFLALVLALVPSAVLVARHGSAARKMKIPFAPFLALGGLIGLFAGHALLHWYLGLT
jgi:leader peptidase (prepilin peptidase)/N-methyltransferase